MPAHLLSGSLPRKLAQLLQLVKILLLRWGLVHVGGTTGLSKDSQATVQWAGAKHPKAGRTHTTLHQDGMEVDSLHPLYHFPLNGHLKVVPLDKVAW